MIVITLLFGVFYLVDLQRPFSRYEPYDPRFSGLMIENKTISCPPSPNQGDQNCYVPFRMYAIKRFCRKIYFQKCLSFCFIFMFQLLIVRQRN